MEGGEERLRTSGLSQSMRVFVVVFTYFVSRNWPCVLEEKWHRKEHTIIITIIIII